MQQVNQTQYFVAQYHRETAGMTPVELGIWFSLKQLYWKCGGELPPDPGKHIGVKNEQERELLKHQLERFYPSHAGTGGT